MTSPNESETVEYIAIVGMATRLPGAPDLESFWDLLKSSQQAIKSFSEKELLEQGLDLQTIRDPKFVSAKGYLPDVDQFDAPFFGFSPREASLVDPQHRVMMEVAWQAMEHAGYDPEQWDGRCAIFTSAGMNTYLPFNIFTNPGLIEQVGGFQLSIYNDKDFVPTRIAYALNSHGPAIDIGTACSSSLVGVHLACQHLLTYQSDLALVGGVTIHLPQESGYLAEAGSAYSPDGLCRPFDATPSGLVDGNGAAAIVLKRLSEAIEDADTIHAIIRASAINNDGSDKIGYSAPSIEGQAEVIREAQALAGITADQISYIEAHGTATPLGDPIEVAGLTQAFRQTTDQKQFCGLGSVKSNIGHVDKAAGLAGLIKTVLALEHEAIPANLHWCAPNPKLNLPETPFYVVDQLKAWPRARQQPRIAGISSFGVGGTNSHAIVQEAPVPESRPASKGSQLLVLSAKTESALSSLAQQLASHLQNNPTQDLADIAHTLQVGRKRMNWRTAIVCDSHQSARVRLEGPLATRSYQESSRNAVFMFSGQGTQHAGMGQSLYEMEPVYRDVIDECAAILEPLLGLDIRDLLYPAVDEIKSANDRLTQTALAQPALFATEYALAQLWMHWGVQPKAVLGHSLGEYVAACVAGVFTLEDGLRLIAERGRLMQSMPTGKMLAVSMSEQEVLETLSAQYPELDIAAVNGATQCVVAGPAQAIEAFERDFTEKSVMVRSLQTSHAFHSRMMEPMLSEYANTLAQVTLRAPTIALVSNLTCDWVDDQCLQNPEYWLDHIREPVRFHQSLHCLAQSDAHALWIEVGPGRALTGLAGLVKRDEQSPSALASLPPPQSKADARSFLLEALGQWWVHGGKVNWAALHEQRLPARVPLPTYPFERSSHWTAPGKSNVAHSTELREQRQKNPANWFYHVDWRQESQIGELASDIKQVLVMGADQLKDELVQAFEASGKQVFYSAADADVTPDLVLYMTDTDSITSSATPYEYCKPLLDFTRQMLSRPSTKLVRICVAGQEFLAAGSADTQMPVKAALLGLLRTLPYEFTQIQCQAIDIQQPKSFNSRRRLAQQIVNQTLQTKVSESVVLRNGNTWIANISPQNIAEHNDVPTTNGLTRDDASYLILGGISDIGLTMVRALTQSGVRRVIVTSDVQGPKISQEHQAELENLRADGKVDIQVADLSAYTEAQIKAIIEHHHNPDLPLAAVIDATDMHASKPTGLIQALDDDQLASYWLDQRQKLQELAAAIEHIDLDYCLLMSSLTAQLGGTGQLASTVASLYTQAFAHQRNQAQGTAWHVIQWDAWSVSEPELISPSEGELAMAMILRMTDPGLLLVSTRSPQAKRERTLLAKSTRASQVDAQSGPRHQRPNLSTALRLAQTEQEKTMVSIWQQFLGIDTIGLDDDFFELGGNSLLATQLLLEVKEAFGVSIELGQLFATPNAGALSQCVLDALMSNTSEQELLSQLDALENLSDEEVSRLLEQGELPEELLKGLNERDG